MSECLLYLSHCPLQIKQSPSASGTTDKFRFIPADPGRLKYVTTQLRTISRTAASRHRNPQTTRQTVQKQTSYLRSNFQAYPFHIFALRTNTQQSPIIQTPFPQQPESLPVSMILRTERQYQNGIPVFF